MNEPFAESGAISVDRATPVVSYSPVRLQLPDRIVPLEVKVSAPLTGTRLPIILLSHGHGVATFLSSLHGYSPLVDFWAAHGFAVVQPTHLDSTLLGFRDEPLPDAPLFWRDRAFDLHAILDRLDEIEAQVPGLAGRLDHERIAAVGHSLGGHTVSLLLGMRVLDPSDSRDQDLADPRIRAGVVIGAPGRGHDLADWAAENYPTLKHVDFATMTGTALVVAGDRDLNPNFSARLSYRSDAYTHSPGGNKTLATFIGAEHMYGGVSGYDAAETSDPDPHRVATLRALVWAYVRSRLDPNDRAWDDAVDAVTSAPDPIVTIETK